jgi:hypothetical protein
MFSTGAFDGNVLVRHDLGLHADRCPTRTLQQLSFARLRSDRERALGRALCVPL